jgi:hypothetical protein
VRAFKFLLDGQVAPFSNFRWPVDEWVASTDHAACHSGIHACDPGDLPYWLMDELWEIELAGSITRGQHKLVAERGRLVRRVHAWDPAARDAFGQACVNRVRELARRRPEAEEHLADLASWAPQIRPAAAASLAARAFEAVQGRDGYDAERTAQTHWLLEQLSLPVH